MSAGITTNTKLFHYNSTMTPDVGIYVTRDCLIESLVIVLNDLETNLTAIQTSLGNLPTTSPIESVKRRAERCSKSHCIATVNDVSNSYRIAATASMDELKAGHWISPLVAAEVVTGVARIALIPDFIITAITFYSNPGKVCNARIIERINIARGNTAKSLARKLVDLGPIARKLCIDKHRSEPRLLDL